MADSLFLPTSSKETLENPATLRNNGLVSGDVDMLDGRQAVRFW